MADYIIFAGTVINGIDDEPMYDMAIGISGEEIEFIKPKDKVNTDGCEVLDLGDRTVMPGLWDCHVHLALKHPFPEYRTDVEPIPYLTMRCYSQAQKALEAGFTSLRMVGEAKQVDLNLKKAINRGLVAGPNIFGAGNTIIPTGGHGFNSLSCIETDGPIGFASLTREQLKAGADLIKMCISGGLGSPHEAISDSQATVEEMSAAVEMAEKAGKHVTVHGSAPGPVQDAITAGVHCIEHAYELDEQTVQMMADNKTYLCPTLLVTNCEDYLRRNGAPPWQLEKQKEAARTHFAGFALALEANIPILAGTDLLPTDEVDDTWAGLREIELLVEGGMKNAQAIRAATRTPAEILEVEDRIGTLAPSMLADMVVMPENPLDDIAAIRDIQMVIKSGEVIRRDF